MVDVDKATRSLEAADERCAPQGSRGARARSCGRTLTLRSRAHRQGARIRTRGEVRYQVGATSSWSRGELLEVGHRGLVMSPARGAAPLEAGTAIAGTLQLPTAPHAIEFLGEVVRFVLDGDGAHIGHAVRLLYVPEGDRNLLGQALTRALQPESRRATVPDLPRCEAPALAAAPLAGRTHRATLTCWPVPPIEN